MNIHYLQHVPFEGPGSIEQWALANGHQLSATRLYAGEQLPALNRFDMLLILGGPMSVHDEFEHVWLKAEKWFIRQVLESGKPILGICLGAQLLAEALGAEITRAEHKEIGWHSLRLEEAFRNSPIGTGLPQETDAFHWHGETFTLPAGSLPVGSSEACASQGFLYRGHVLALQFHLETTPLSAELLIENSPDDLATPGPYIQPPESMLEGTDNFNKINALMTTLLNNLTAGTASVQEHG